MQRSDAMRQWCVRMRVRDTLHHAYLFTGPLTKEKKDFLRDFASLILCDAVTDAGACGVCASCVAYARGVHPDILTIGIDATRASIGIDEVRAIKAHSVLRSIGGAHRIVMIHDAEKCTDAASNAFLKLLEEPPERCILIMSAQRKNDMLPTIVSRCFHIPLYLGGNSVQLPLYDADTSHGSLKAILSAPALDQRMVMIRALFKTIEGAGPWVAHIDGWLCEANMYMSGQRAHGHRKVWVRIVRALIRLKKDVQEYSSPKLYVEHFILNCTS